MSQSVTVPVARRGAVPTHTTAARDRWVRRRVTLVWGLLVLNVLTFDGGQSVFPLPNSVGKLITQGSLPVAIVLALTVNRRLVIRPNVFLCLVSLLVIEASVTALQAQYLRSTGYRTFRLAEFVIALWLLTPFWDRRDLLLLRAHLKAMGVVLASVLLGLALSPGRAMGGGRLIGVIWPIPATQVAHYAAVTIGLVSVLWLCDRQRGRVTLAVVAAAGTVLVLTVARTALAALIGGIVVAGLSLIAANARTRRMFATAGIIVAAGVLTLSGFITNWLARGQSSSQIIGLTGRTSFWGPLLAFPRDRFQELFGFGLSNDQFNGLPIDSNWFTSYQDQGLFGVTVCAIILIFLFVMAYFQPRGLPRALALFLITYCLLASFTEVGFTSASPYLLDLTLAASFLTPPAVDWRPARE
jgi:hypothetical protein